MKHNSYIKVVILFRLINCSSRLVLVELKVRNLGINKKPLKSIRPDCRQFDLENLKTKVKVKVTIEINRTCYWLPSAKVSSL